MAPSNNIFSKIKIGKSYIVKTKTLIMQLLRIQFN